MSETYAFPLSFAQQRLWFLDRMAPGNPFYNIALAVPINASVDVRALERALNAIVARHESLRTLFRVVDGEPAQIVLPALELSVAFHDLRSLREDERKARTAELATREAQTPFDLEAGPLIRCGLVMRAPLDHVLLLTMHHIISDGWSMGILAQELTALYVGFLAGYAAPLPELPIQYPDFAMWQRELLHGGVLEEHLAYWRRQLERLPPLELPTDRPRPPMVTYRGNVHLTKLSPALSNAVRRFAQLHQATPFMVLLAAFAALLHRYSGQDDLAIGTSVANRNRAEIEGLIGFFVNSLVLRIDAGDATFTELVARTRDVALDAYAHQDLPFEKLVEELQPVRDPARNPLFQVTFQLLDLPTVRRSAHAAPASAVQVQHGSAIFDIAFTLVDDPDGFSGLYEYSTDLFDAATIARMDAHFQQLLEAALAQPHVPISALPMIDANERAAILRASIGAATGVDPDPFVHHRVAEQAERTPDAIAVLTDDGQLTYRELVDRARQLAHHLRAAGVDRDELVAVLMDRSTELVTALLGVLEAGGAYVPLDPAYPLGRLRFMFADSGARRVVTHARYETLAAELAGRANVVSLDAGADVIRAQPVTALDVALHPESLAYVIYTSGSTGGPKGAGIPHRALANHMSWFLERFPCDASDRVLQRTPYGFDASVWEFYAPLMRGGCLVLLPPEAHRDAEETVRRLARHGITIVQFVPALLRIALDVPELYTCTTLRRIFCGGEALADELRRRVVDDLGIELVNLYGPTETTIDATYSVCSECAEPFGVPIGEPASNVNAYVLDEHLQLVPAGVHGELYVGGRGVARGYLGRPALTAERFLPDPFSGVAGARMYRSGDRVRRRAEDGALIFTGRLDQQVKLRGFRIELREVETSIRQLESVRDCAVLADDATALTAFLVPNVGDIAPDSADEQVSRWREVYEHVYGELSESQDAAFNTVGWNSSYTGLPLGGDEMAEWRAQTVERIRRLRPSRVLEIGCGAGLLLTQLAPHCERYVATDFSAPVIDYLRAQLDAPNVTLLNRTADDFAGIEPGSFDTVILNSVVQYFPDAGYFERVLRGAANAVAPGGAVFVGDLRSLPLQPAFQLSLARHHSPAADAEELRQRMRIGIEQEQELVIDPWVLCATVKEIGAVEVSLKRGRFANELTRFRYDAVIRVGQSVDHSSIDRFDWERHQLTTNQLEEWLASGAFERLIVEGVPNARVAEEATAIDPEELWQLGERCGYDVRIRFSAPPRVHAFDVILRRHDAAPIHDAGVASGPLGNQPLRGAITRRLGARIRETLAAQLPEYMVPSAFVLLDELPLLPAGKIDRAALAALRSARTETSSSSMPPRTTLEEALAILWAEVLETERVGIRDDFFSDLGGHSLLATRLISRIRVALQTEIPLKQVFAAPTVETFAAATLENAAPDERQRIESAAALVVKLSRFSEAELDHHLLASQVAAD